MPLRDLLRKHDKIQGEAGQHPQGGPAGPSNVPEFTFLRTTTTTQEQISPPSFPNEGGGSSSQDSQSHPFHVRRHSNNSANTTGDDSKSEKRLSARLGLSSRSRSRSGSSASENIPANLPDIQVHGWQGEDGEAQWEQRATLLATGASISRPSTPGANRGGRGHNVGDAGGDEDIQEAISLHENGDLEQSTAMFGRLADPNGANNALSQVLYGLALRHGWGCSPNPDLAVTYLSYAASNSAEVESQALRAGMKKGGAAKGELVLAIFELANCFRYGMGVKKDAAAAKQYYETAANLGDVDAMNEIAWCYLEGFGCKKDKFKAAQYLRLAEEKGGKTVGNSWIWKEKYNPSQ